MAHNRFDGKQAECRVCGFRWSVKSWEEAEKEDCPRCKDLITKYPDLVTWILAVVEVALDKHISYYQHGYNDDY